MTRSKRIFDLLLAFLLLVVLMPVMIVIAALIRLVDGAPVFYISERMRGPDRAFGLIKFRTMTEACDENGQLLPDAQRLTPVGRFVRETSLDEAPQLINVLKGEMSLIGPRPLLVKYLDRYDEAQRRRHDVKPGITGLSQVNGRDDLPIDKKLAFEVRYVDNFSFSQDIHILLKTFPALFSGRGNRC